MRFIDVHTHFFNADNDSITDISENYRLKNSVKLFSAGIHPKTLKKFEELTDNFRIINLLAQEKNCAAIGECGLDKFSLQRLEEQEKIFEAQIIIAQRFNKPLIIHCVRLYNEVLRILKTADFSLPVIFHSYNGNVQTTKSLLKYDNINFSFSEKTLTGFKSLEIIPLEKIFTESDMNPDTDFNGLITKVAKIKNVDFQEVADKMKKNFAFFSKTL